MTDRLSAHKKAGHDRRLDAADALGLYEAADLLELAALAHEKRMALNPQRVVSFVVDRNINYTNVCESRCHFCAFYRPAGHSEAYVITRAELKKKIEETLSVGGTQILLQGGMHPGLDLKDYQTMLRFIKSSCPIHIHGFSPPEIAYLAEKSNISLTETIEALKAAGLDSIPGGGAEILVDRIRRRISPRKCSAGTWLEVMKTAHRLGLKSTATMMFGHIETGGQIIEHLQKIRDLQDETGGFTAFIPWTFQPGNTRIEVSTATAAEYLRVLALSRIFLDNIPNIQASWVTQGAKIAQLALTFGANDMGSTMIEENVVAAAGVKFKLSVEEMKRLIADAGFTPRQRDCFYNFINHEKTVAING